MPFVQKFNNIISRLQSIERELERTRMAIAQSRIYTYAGMTPVEDLALVEFQVFSQWGEDGIIQYLIAKVPIEEKVFVEFGVQDYRESNTRFLLMNNNWKGLILDQSEEYIDYIRSQSYFWRYDLDAKCAFIDAENIKSLIANSNIKGDIGLLSIDVDGNDYWIWKAIDNIVPRIVVIEYNSVFGNERAVTIPYNPQFSRSQAHYSNLYFGASLPAMCLLAKEKGYVFAGSNSNGSNAFFVRQDLANNIIPTEAKRGFVESKVRESRDETGKRTYLSGKERLDIIANMELIDVTTGKSFLVKDLSN
jgi:hypothetical protein